MGKKRVQGYNNLYRNESGAIVSTDISGYEAYKRKRNSSKLKQDQIDNLGNQLGDAKKEIDELKDLIKQMLSK
jgi:peptidoglycan hydrolase CwlO-like protein